MVQVDRILMSQLKRLSGDLIRVLNQPLHLMILMILASAGATDSVGEANVPHQVCLNA